MLIQWIDRVPLLSGVSHTLVPGFYEDVTPYLTSVDCSDKTFMTWSILTEKAATFIIQGAVSGALGTFDTLLTVNIVGGAINTPYDLAAPMNNTGVYVLTRPILHLVLTDAAAGDHAWTRVYVKAW